MDIELTPEESSVLHASLQSYLSNLGMEIADTDDRTFREGLHHKRDALTQVVTKLDEAVQHAESGQGGDEARVINIRWTITTANPTD